jgi:hypothetical protein
MMLLTPFPWYQDPGPVLLVYQFMDYPQVLLGLTVLCAAWIGRREILKSPSSRFLLITFLIYFASTIVSSALHQRYMHVALPLMIMAAGPALASKWGRSLAVSVSLLVVAHLLYEAARLMR